MNSVNTANGPKSVLNFSLAVQKRTKDNNGNYETLWVDCAVWGERADKLSQYITKGTKLAVSGSVDVDSYDGQNGVVPKLTMMVNELTLQGGGQHQGQNQSNQSQQGGYQQQPQQQAQGGFNQQQPMQQQNQQQGGFNQQAQNQGFAPQQQVNQNTDAPF
jgi:single-strand DNA-binding protein